MLNWRGHLEHIVTGSTAVSCLAALFVAIGVSACGTVGGTMSGQPVSSSVQCDPQDGGIELPDGFCAVVVAEDLGQARHLTVNDNGDIYVKLRSADEGGGIVALRDTDGDGTADVEERFGDIGGTGIDIYDGHLYYTSEVAVYRVPLGGGLVPQENEETIVEGLPEQGSHAAKSIAFDEAGHLYVNVGGPSNACQVDPRTPGSSGQDPCPQLERQGGIWRFDADEAGQTQQQDGHRFATGIRNAVALAWNPAADNLYAVQHGRDQLHTLWSDMFTEEESAELPAEELFLVEDGDNFGWPYCYYDHLEGRKVLAPEYGGDGQQVGQCGQYEDPIMAFPGHWGPNDLMFYTGRQFPGRYLNGAFIAFHGSWNRAPLPQRGYRVTFVPFDGELPSGGYTTFADDFIGAEVIRAPGDAEFRPMGLAEGPDGSLYLSDSRNGRIWRIVYTGE